MNQRNIRLLRVDYIIAIFIHKTRTCTQPRLAGVADLP